MTKTIDEIMLMVDALSDAVADNEHKNNEKSVRSARAAVVDALQRDTLSAVDDELLAETARFRAEVERLNLKVAALQLDNDLFYKSMMELP